MVGHNFLLLRDFGPYVIIFMNVCVRFHVLTAASMKMRAFWAITLTRLYGSISQKAVIFNVCVVITVVMVW
jgi:hypothetical protein